MLDPLLFGKNLARTMPSPRFQPNDTLLAFLASLGAHLGRPPHFAELFNPAYSSLPRGLPAQDLLL